MGSELMPLLPTIEAAREYLEGHPRAWPFAMAAVQGFIGVGQAAGRYGMDPDSFARVCTAAGEKVEGVVNRGGATRPATV